MIAFVANTMFIAFVYARRTKNPVIRSYLLYTIILETWLFTHIFYWASPFETWTTWAFRILSITWLPVGLFYLEFVYIFSQNLNSRTQTTKSRSLLGSKTFSLEIIKEKDESLHILFGDVSGHGISAAMVAAMTSIAFKLELLKN